MNKSFLKFITDFGPLLIFFTIYYKSGNSLKAAIPPLIISTLIAVAIMYFVEKKVPFVPLIGAIVISLFGGLTLYFNNPIFIYLKPTIINLIFAAALLISDIFLKKNLLISGNLRGIISTNKSKVSIEDILSWGDDYELVFTAHKKFKNLINNLGKKNNIKLTNVGKVIKDRGIYDDSMNIIKNPSSFDHFS